MTETQDIVIVSGCQHGMGVRSDYYLIPRVAADTAGSVEHISADIPNKIPVIRRLEGGAVQHAALAILPGVAIATLAVQDGSAAWGRGHVWPRTLEA